MTSKSNALNKPKSTILRIGLLIMIFILVPAGIVFADGEAGNALSFDGMDDYVVLDETNTVLGGTSWKDTKTVSLWIKPEGISSVCDIDVVRCDAVFGDRPRWWGISRGVLNSEDRIWVFNYDGSIDKVGIQYTAGEWLHISMVHNGGVMTVYKNGELVQAIPSGTTQLPDTGAIPKLYIGGMIVGLNEWLYEGDIDEVRLYTTALTQSEIQNTMFEELLGDETGLAAYYTMNVLNGNTLPDDQESNLHEGTLNGSSIGAPPYLTISAAFDKPVTMDQFVVTDENSAIGITLFGADKQNDPLTYEIDTQPANGVLTGSGENRIYTPNANYSGSDIFTYTVSDSSHTSAVGVVSITVNPSNGTVLDEVVYLPLLTR